MSARRRKATRQAAYGAGPLAPWRSLAYVENWRQFLRKRGRLRPEAMMIGRYTGITLHLSKEIA